MYKVIAITNTNILYKEFGEIFAGELYRTTHFFSPTVSSQASRLITLELCTGCCTRYTEGAVKRR